MDFRSGVMWSQRLTNNNNLNFENKITLTCISRLPTTIYQSPEVVNELINLMGKQLLQQVLQNTDFNIFWIKLYE